MVGEEVKVAVRVRVGVGVSVGVYVGVAVAVKVAEGVFVHMAAVAVWTVAANVACAAGERLQAERNRKTVSSRNDLRCIF